MVMTREQAIQAAKKRWAKDKGSRLRRYNKQRQAKKVEEKNISIESSAASTTNGPSLSPSSSTVTSSTGASHCPKDTELNPATPGPSSSTSASTLESDCHRGTDSNVKTSNSASLSPSASNATPSTIASDESLPSESTDSASVSSDPPPTPQSTRTSNVSLSPMPSGCSTPASYVLSSPPSTSPRSINSNSAQFELNSAPLVSNWAQFGSKSAHFASATPCICKKTHKRKHRYSKSARRIMKVYGIKQDDKRYYLHVDMAKWRQKYTQPVHVEMNVDFSIAKWKLKR